MRSTKISFAINEKEGLVELRRRQDEAGASSLGLYVKQLVREHLAHDGDEAMARLTDSVEHLRAAVLQLNKKHTEMIRQQNGDQAAVNLAVQINDLQKRLLAMFTTLLQCEEPMSPEKTAAIVRNIYGGDK